MTDMSPEDDFLGDVSIPADSVDDRVYQSTKNGFKNSTAGDDEPPPLDESEPGPIGDGQCAICGAPTFRPPGLTPTGRRKRVPKYCDLHARDIRAKAEGPDAPKLESQLRQIQQELADQLKLAGILTGPLFPVTGFYIQDNADVFVTALLQTTRDKERLLKLLYRAAKVAPIYKLLEFGAGVGVAVQVDQKKVDPHSSYSRHLGVERAYEAIYSSISNDSGIGNSSTPTPPPRYATVQ